MDPTVPLLVSLGVICLVITLWRPLFGLLMVVLVNQVDSYVGVIAAGLSPGRVVGAVTLAGWAFKLYRQRSSSVAREPRLNLLLLGFALAAVISSGVNGFSETSIAATAKLLMLILLAVLVQDLVDRWDDAMKVVWVVALAYGASGFVGIYQYYMLQQGTQVEGLVQTGTAVLRLAGLRENPNGYGMVLMSGIPFLYYVVEKARRTLYRVFYLLVLAGSGYSLLLTISRTHILGFLVFNAVYFAYKLNSRRTRLLAVVFSSVLFAAGAFYVSTLPTYVTERMLGVSPDEDDSSYGRLLLFQKGVQLFLENPLLGVGPDNGARHGPMSGMSFHDVLSATMGELGLAGIVLLALLALETLLLQRHILRVASPPWTGDVRDLAIVVHAAFVAFLVSGVGNVITNQRLFWTYLGLTAVLHRAGARSRVRAAGRAAPPAAARSRTVLVGG